jgi:predicted AlkP superfamily pyrophosphatase or phosphodiesterase
MAFWYHGGDHGHFISSTYYDEQLPSWAAEFNQTNPSQKYLNTWETLYPIDTYTASGADRNDYERPFSGIEQAVFPYDLEELAPKNGGFSILKATPYGNTLVTDFALEALKGEEMGTDDIPDFLTVSYSSTDYIGHQFGVNSVEVEDTYLRLDREIERLLKALDKQVGDGNYTVFLTADHAAIHVPQYLKDHGMQAGYVDGDAFAKAITEEIEAEFDTSGIIEKVKGYNIYLDRKTLRENNIKYTEAEAFLAEIVQQQPSIYSVFTRTALMNGSFTDPIGTKVSNGFHPRRSGDLVFIPDPGYIDYPEVGSTHGSPMNYDSHVPLLFYGKGVTAGESYERHDITDIAPTVSAILGIAQPTACTGNPITEVLD